MISNTCKYALRACIYLAINQKDNQKIGIKTIAEDLAIPSPFLGKIMQTLSKHKLLISTKGPHGGFALGRNMDDITFMDIVEIIDGTDVFHQCLFGLTVCLHDKKKQTICPLHPESGPLRKELYDLFKKQTIGDIARKVNATDQVIEF